jgi:hypothetical protein
MKQKQDADKNRKSRGRKGKNPHTAESMAHSKTGAAGKSEAYGHHNWEGCGNSSICLIPAKAGVQELLKKMDSGFRRNDKIRLKAAFQQTVREES